MKQSTKNKIMKAGDRGVPNAEKKMKDLKLGPALPNIKQAKKDNGGGKGGSPGTHTPNWDKDWPKKTPLKPKLARTRKTNSANA